MELSCKSEYALLALMALADSFKDNEPLQIRQISARQEIPDRYLEQLLAILRRSGLVRSQRGARGGYILAREPWQITVLEVMNSIEGQDADAIGGSKSAETAEKKVLKDLWKGSCEAMRGILQKHTLQDLCDRRDAQKQAELMYYI
ncbi:RrF2 family transcriptional regulator [Altericista sp. CCNU0014]|uniref:RrF2 family transcriptional regulator n=1 Tax=Altericista sp. CCNU0014 TaxID=3082949 RepID=UPI00384D46D1